MTTEKPMSHPYTRDQIIESWKIFMRVWILVISAHLTTLLERKWNRWKKGRIIGGVVVRDCLTMHRIYKISKTKQNTIKPKPQQSLHKCTWLDGPVDWWVEWWRVSTFSRLAPSPRNGNCDLRWLMFQSPSKGGGDKEKQNYISK